jgi:hypothetical protein
MKHKIFIASILAAANFLNIGCVSSVSSTYDNVKRSLTPKSNDVNPLYGQVPEQDKERVNQLQQQLDITKQTHLISKMREKLSDLNKDRSDNDVKRLNQLQKEQELRIKLAQLEAIDRNQLGDKIDNLESITDVHVDAIEVQKKRLKYEGAVSVIDVKIKQLEVAIDKEVNKLNEMTGTKSEQIVTTN